MPLSSLLKVFKSNGSAPSDNTLRIGLIGAGRMGQFHAKHLSRHANIAFAGVVDPHENQANALAKKYRIRAYREAEELLGQVDAVVIASPTPTHFSIGKRMLEAGISCLIEKPLASNLEEAEALIHLAEAKSCILQVGHIERFNPAVIEAAEHIDRPQFIEVDRLGPYDPRVAHIGVVMDLMIHDLDIVLFLVKEPVTNVEAFGAKVLSEHEDIAKVRLTFANGCIADLSASRISLKKYRHIRVFQKNAYLSIDYAAPSLKIYRKKSDVVRSLSDIDALRPRLSKKDPLALELDHFVRCVISRQTPLVSGKHGRDALGLAQDVLKRLKVHA